jgi:hypothetical protein
MYCRMCGKMIDDTDRHCRFCGAPTGSDEAETNTAETAESIEEVVFNPPFKRDDELNESFHLTEEESLEPPKSEENLKEFISDNEIKEQHKLKEKAEEQGVVKDREFIWNIHEFPKTKKTEDVEFSWKMDEFGQPAQKEAAVTAFEEELFNEIREDASRIRESNIDRFFTFSRKNEEFQELLDKEYEKFNRKTGIPYKDHTAESSHKTEMKKSSAEDETDKAEHQNIQTELRIAEPQTEGTSEPLKAETESETPGEPIKAEPEKEITSEPIDAIPRTEETPHKPSKAEHLSEMEQARAIFFGEELIKDNETIIKKLSSNDAAADDGAALQTGYNQEEAAEQDMPLQPVIAEEPVQQEIHKEIPEQIDKEARVEKMEETSPIKPSKDIIQDNEENIEPEKEEKEKKVNRAGTIALTVIAIILVAEIAILGIRLIAPESGAAQAINKTQNSMSRTISEAADRISNLFSGKDSTDKTKQEDQTKTDQQKKDNTVEEQPQAPGQKTTAPDPAPMADKDALIASQIGNNVNIQQIKANASLAYQEGRDYGLKDINQSKPIENNIWLTTSSGETTYYDKSVVGTVIAFDSQWIDYVNRESKGVLNLLKKGSPAYKKTVGYSKAGKISENFRILEIGEIRQGAKGFYVWVHEEIQITEKGTTKSQKYNWIYYMEPVDGKMNIVNYFKFK